jgi:HEPN domain-containing protein
MTAAIDQARVLLSKASQDEALVRKVSSDTDIADELIGFHAQQAVEKAMKAVLVAADIEFPFSHDLGLLRDLCKQAGTPLPDEIGDISELTPYAAWLRYDDNELLELVDRETALKWASTAVRWAHRQVESKEPPKDEEVDAAQTQ